MFGINRSLHSDLAGELGQDDLCRLLLLDLKGLQHGCCSLLNTLARSFDSGDGLFATSGPRCDVSQAMFGRIETENLKYHKGPGTSFRFSEC